MSQIQRILCPTDFSECSERAFERAIDLARTLGASVHLAHVHELVAYSSPEGALLLTDPIVLQRINDGLRRELAKKAEKVEGVTVTTGLTEGWPAREIVRLAEELPADLIVIGTHGRSGFQRFLLGSVAEKVLRTSKVPVVTVPCRHVES